MRRNENQADTGGRGTTPVVTQASFLAEVHSAGDRLMNDGPVTLGECEQANHAESSKEIVNAGERAARLTRQLLAFSRRQVLQPTLIAMNTLVNDTSKMLQRLIGEHIEFVTVLAPDLAPVRADAGQLEQVLVNLAVNAKDAMAAGGRLTIETATVELDAAYAQKHVGVRQGWYVMLSVTDTGVGMDASTRLHLFEPFFTTKGPGTGTGLGVATVHGIVEQSGGHVWVHSEVGRGTTFKVYFPCEKERRQSSTRRLQKNPQSAQKRSYLWRMKTPSGSCRARCSSAPVITSTMPRARNRPTLCLPAHGDAIDLLVTDVVMPGSSGPVLFQHLAGRRAGLKVLYMSGYAEGRVLQASQLEAGAVFLQKPFSAGGLVRKVREALEATTNDDPLKMELFLVS